jgi:microcystin-dependent protein
MDPLLASIILFAGNFAPRGWAFCSGQILSIAQNTALFSLLGTTYGGNGQTTFALPDLRGRTPIGPGQGPGLPNVSLGEVSGATSQTLLVTQMPAHTHTTGTFTIPAVSSSGNSNLPGAGKKLAKLVDSRNNPLNVYSDAVADTSLEGSASMTIGTAGNSQPFSIMQPYLGMNYIIAMEGIFPSRN